VVQSGGPGGARPIFVPKNRAKPAVVQAPPAETSPPPVYGRPAEAETAPGPVDVPAGQIQSDQAHERNVVGSGKDEVKALLDEKPGKGKRKGKGKAPK
jgi:hypothetical protein